MLSSEEGFDNGRHPFLLITLLQVHSPPTSLGLPPTLGWSLREVWILDSLPPQELQNTPPLPPTLGWSLGVCLLPPKGFPVGCVLHPKSPTPPPPYTRMNTPTLKHSNIASKRKNSFGSTIS